MTRWLRSFGVAVFVWTVYAVFAVPTCVLVMYVIVEKLDGSPLWAPVILCTVVAILAYVAAFILRLIRRWRKRRSDAHGG